MGKQDLYTKHGHNMFEVSSMIQKALRRGLVKDAYYAANEMSDRYRTYLWKRLLTVSSEDCFDLLSKNVFTLYEQDKQCDPIEKRNIAEAVALLLNARKNRDADYFACNLFNSKHKVELNSIEPTLTEAASMQYATKNGHSMFDCSAALVSAIKQKDFVNAGYCGNELYWRYRKFFWKTMKQVASFINQPLLTEEIEYLEKIDDSQQSSTKVSSLFACKSILVSIKTLLYGIDIFEQPSCYQVVKLEQFDNIVMQIPQYVFDVHTYKGKRAGKTKKEFVVEEQNALKPHKQGDFDNASWDRYFDMCETGFLIDELSAPWPDKKRLKELDHGTVQLSLF